MDDEEVNSEQVPSEDKLDRSKVGGTTSQGRGGRSRQPGMSTSRQRRQGGDAKCAQYYLFFLRLFIFLEGVVRWPTSLPA